MLKEFREFAMKGSVLDLAIGVVIGAAFGSIVKSAVEDILMPIIGALFGGLDFTNYFFGLSSAVNADTLEKAKEQGAVLAYGSFFTAVVNFVLIAIFLFVVVKGVNTMRRKEEAAPAAPAAPPRSEVLLEEIRDLLAKKK
jgi:large conductance mechanosensitive channel